jgi:hypothetical protein
MQRPDQLKAIPPMRRPDRLKAIPAIRRPDQLKAIPPMRPASQNSSLSISGLVLLSLLWLPTVRAQTEPGAQLQPNYEELPLHAAV